MNHLKVEIDDTLDSLLELAANNDVKALKRSVERDTSTIDEVGEWYGRKKVIEQRTPLMVAATYGSVDVLELIIGLSAADVNRVCGADKTTALHCAASGGSSNAVEAAKILLSSGADPNVVDADGRRPADLIVVPRKSPNARAALEELLGCPSSAEEDGSPSSATTKAVPEKKEYPIDPSIPDIKNSMYATDEFRMFSFKVRPCSRAYSHDWTECPFVHPGENARRRDPRKYHYSCVPCPDFRKGTCRRGDMCEYAHGVFECWLHPAQYRTRLCKDGTSCTRRVCFFAHTGDELRPLYVSTGSAVPSPRSSSSADVTAMGLVPGSPSSLSGLASPFTPPMSPSTNGMSHSSLNWPLPNVPALHLPGSNLQSSRLRSALSARDMQEFETHQLINDLCISRLASGTRASRSKNLDELLSAEVASSPRYNSEQGGGVFSPSRKTVIPSHSSLLQASLGVSSPGRMSPRGVEPVSPLSSHLSAFALREKQSLRSLSSRDLGASSLATLGLSRSRWGSPPGSFEWDAAGEELRRSSSFDLRFEEPDVSWVHSLVKEEKPAAVTTASVGSSAAAPAGVVGQNEGHDHAAALMAWLEQMQIDQMVA